MCNLYSVKTSRKTLIEKFRLSDNRIAAFDPLSAIFPGHTAPIIKQTVDGDRELVLRSWGFILLRDGYAPKRVTNARDDKLDTKFWKDSFEKRRCLVPATSFCEPDEKKPAGWHWFALKDGKDQRPLFAFAGLYRQWRGPIKKRRTERRYRGLLVLDDVAQHSHADDQPRAQPRASDHRYGVYTLVEWDCRGRAISHQGQRSGTDEDREVGD